MAKRAWILGAGFSRSLGGPLLVDLLSSESEENLKFRYPKAPQLAVAQCTLARSLYAYGVRDGREHGQRLWTDAEEFLDMLDAATSAGDASAPWRLFARRIRRVHAATLGGHSSEPAPDVRGVRDGARRLMAAECAAFLVDADPNTEKWQPYIHWLAYLTPGDVIITFNYDRVIETIAQKASLNVHVVSPGKPLDPTKTNLLKLHGSVDWRRVPEPNNSVSFEVTQEPDFCVGCPEHELAIASPGPSKETIAKELVSLWDEAQGALATADLVLFVGYRFPPTDAAARTRLLAALNHNRLNRRSLRVHTVLGPNVNSDNSARIRGLIAAVTYEAPIQHALFAEDFLGLVPSMSYFGGPTGIGS